MRVDEARGLVRLLGRRWYDPVGGVHVKAEADARLVRVSYAELECAAQSRASARARIAPKRKNARDGLLRISAGNNVFTVDSRDCDVFDAVAIKRISVNNDGDAARSSRARDVQRNSVRD